MDGEKTVFTINSGKELSDFYVYGAHIHDAGCTIRGCAPSGGDAYGWSISGAGNYVFVPDTDVGHLNTYIGWSETDHQSNGHAFYVWGHRYGDKAANTKIHDSYFHDNSMGGSRMGGGDSNGGDGNYGFVDDLYYYNNVLANNESGITLGDAASNTGGAGGTYYIYNNTLYQDSSGCYGFECGTDLDCNFYLSNNICYNTTRYINGDECSAGENNPNAHCSGSTSIALKNIQYLKNTIN
jgi:hypothetical protein